MEKFAATDIRYTTMLAGYSVVCWRHQQEPIIRRGNPWRLEQGMVIAMEPHVNHWHIQDLFLVNLEQIQHR